MSCINEYIREIGVEKDLNSMNMEEMFSKIREFNQYNLYTVNENFCLQLFELDECANDEISCLWEASDKELRKILIKALEYISESIFNRNYDF